MQSILNRDVQVKCFGSDIDLLLRPAVLIRSIHHNLIFFRSNIRGVVPEAGIKGWGN